MVAAGSTHSYFGKDEFAEFAPGMKTVDDARYQRDAILSKFEMAETATDPQERAEWLTFVVIGAGTTGVEVVGQIAELAHQVLPKDYSKVDTRGARILLLEGAPAVLPPFKPKLQQYTKDALEKLGVEIRVSTLAVDMDHESVTVKGPNGVETIRARSRIWAAGVQASPLAKMLAEKSGAETDRPGRIVVGADCSLPGHPEVFAIGDMANVGGLPGVAQPAMQEGKYVGKLIKARMDGDTGAVPPFKYFDKGSMATIGHKYAVADAFGRNFTGIIAYLMWGFIHVLYLIGWGNRLGTIYTWMRALYVSKNRGHRVITFEQAQYRVEESSNSVRPSHYLASVHKSGEASAAAAPGSRRGKQKRHSKAAMLSWRASRGGQVVSAAARGVADDDARADRSVRARWPRLCNPSPTTARKVRQLALCWRVIAFIAHRIGDRTDPDVPAEARRAVDTGSAGPLVTRAILGPRQHCYRCTRCHALGVDVHGATARCTGMPSRAPPRAYQDRSESMSTNNRLSAPGSSSACPHKATSTSAAARSPDWIAPSM